MGLLWLGASREQLVRKWKCQSEPAILNQYPI